MVSKQSSLERKDYGPPLCTEEKSRQAPSEYLNEMNAIARGVEARLDLLIGCSKIVIQRTIDIGRRLSIPEKEIQRWAAMRPIYDSERNEVISHH